MSHYQLVAKALRACRVWWVVCTVRVLGKADRKVGSECICLEK